MDRNETQLLLMMLEQFYPNKKFRDPKALFSAWALALEPYDFETVKRAAADYAAQNKFFPDLADLTAALPRRKAPVKPQRDDTELLRRLLNSSGDCNA